jgi:tungstate transport system ATP-binding protein
MIKIKNLKLRYSDRFNLCIEDLAVNEGNIFTVIGPNGAGKTTLLNIIAMFDKVDIGSVEVFGKDTAKIRNKLPLRREMSFVFSQPYLLKQTVFNNISLPLKLRGIFDKARVEKMLELFKIGHLRDSLANNLSQGEKHRVCLARAFITEPKLVLLDESFSSLDKRYKESLIHELRGIIKSNTTTALFVTQDHSEALSMADTMAVMKDGRILQQDRPQNIFNRPALKEVADFVGVETILPGEIINKEDNLCAVKVGNSIIEAVSEYEAGDKVFVCVRPENVIISLQTEQSSARNHFKARINQILPWALEHKLNLDCGFDLTAFVTRQSLESLGLKIGKEVFVSVKATAIHLIKR